VDNAWGVVNGKMHGNTGLGAIFAVL
jgi:hypothetical protein